MNDQTGKPIGSRLNPQWVCWLMGYPLDWLEGVDAPSGQKNRKKSRAPEKTSRIEPSNFKHLGTR
jgi:hypothetical protein